MFVYEKSPHTNEKTEVDPLFDSVFFLSHKKKHKSVFEYECIVIELPKLKKKSVNFLVHPVKRRRKRRCGLEASKLMLMVIGLMEMKKKKY